MQSAAAPDQQAALEQWRTDSAAAETAGQANQEATQALKEAQGNALAKATAWGDAQAKALRSARELIGYLVPGETSAEDHEEEPTKPKPSGPAGRQRG